MKAARKTNNNKATGDDGIQMELLKYEPYSLFEVIQSIQH